MIPRPESCPEQGILAISETDFLTLVVEIG
jgi:hypothetical protein